MAETGMAILGGHSAATARNSNGTNAIVWLFGGAGGGDVYCGPEFGGLASIGADANIGFVTYAGSTGLAITTIGLAPPAQSSEGQGYTKSTMMLKFRVIPDDPLSTTPVTVDLVMRFRFFDVQYQISGLGTGYSRYLGAYGVGSSPGFLGTTNPNGASEWGTGASFPVANTVQDHHVSTDVQPNVDRYFTAYLEQQSSANGRLFPTGSAALSIASLWSFEATTEDAATIVFEYETLFGLAPPALDTVPEPGLATGLSVATLLGVCFARRRHDRSAS